uniref:Uncharacterized protein n=1 Tax=Sphaerodactylus townsendi TaxID=933632 RepID=A0ACB8G7P5_9SAUR
MEQTLATWKQLSEMYRKAQDLMREVKQFQEMEKKKAVLNQEVEHQGQEAEPMDINIKKEEKKERFLPRSCVSTMAHQCQRREWLLELRKKKEEGMKKVQEAERLASDFLTCTLFIASLFDLHPVRCSGVGG